MPVNLMNIDRKISYILIAIIIAAFIGVIYLMINPSPSEKFTEFYILGPDGKAGNYPSNLTPGENGTVIIGVVNHENANTSYQLTVVFNNNTLKRETFSLKNSEKKEIPFSFNLNQTGNAQKLNFYLYKLPDTQNPYRSLELLVNVNQQI